MITRYARQIYNYVKDIDTELENLKTRTNEMEQYSFSKLSSWHQCKYGFYQKYILHKKGITNAFSEFGSFVHELLEKYAKKEIELWDLPELYEWGFEAAITSKFPYNKYKFLKKSYHDQGLAFMKAFQGYEDYEILGVEQKFIIPMYDWELVGFIDLLFKDENGKLIIRDYKSKASFKNEEEKMQYARQMYLYSMYVKQEYGRFPDELQFLMFRENKTVSIPFDENALNEALEWANGTVNEIRNAFDYPPASENCDDFYAANLCNMRKECMYNAVVKKKRKEK